MPGDICCSGNANAVAGLDPNSFDPASGILSLWGANGFNPAGNSVASYYNGAPSLGMDLRVRMAPVPVPESAGWSLLALGFTALLILRSRRVTA